MIAVKWFVPTTEMSVVLCHINVYHSGYVKREEAKGDDVTRVVHSYFWRSFFLFKIRSPTTDWLISTEVI